MKNGLDVGWIVGQRSKEEHCFYEFAPRDQYFNEEPLDEEGSDIWALNIYKNWIWKAWEREGGREGAKANTTNKEHTQLKPPFSLLSSSLLLIIAKFSFFLFHIFLFFLLLFCVGVWIELSLIRELNAEWGSVWIWIWA